MADTSSPRWQRILYRRQAGYDDNYVCPDNFLKHMRKNQLVRHLSWRTAIAHSVVSVVHEIAVAVMLVAVVLSLLQLQDCGVERNSFLAGSTSGPRTNTTRSLTGWAYLAHIGVVGSNPAVSAVAGYLFLLLTALVFLRLWDAVIARQQGTHGTHPNKLDSRCSEPRGKKVSPLVETNIAATPSTPAVASVAVRQAEQRSLSYNSSVKGVVTLVALLIFLEPVFHTLTSDISSDTVWACSIGFLFFHVALFDHTAVLASGWAYHQPEGASSSSGTTPDSNHGGVATSCGMMATVLFASRLHAESHAAFLFIVALGLFGVAPALRQQLCRLSGYYIVWGRDSGYAIKASSRADLDNERTVGRRAVGPVVISIAVVVSAGVIVACIADGPVSTDRCVQQRYDTERVGETASCVLVAYGVLVLLCSIFWPCMYAAMHNSRLKHTITGPWEEAKPLNASTAQEWANAK